MTTSQVINPRRYRLRTMRYSEVWIKRPATDRERDRKKGRERQREVVGGTTSIDLQRHQRSGHGVAELSVSTTTLFTSASGGVDYASNWPLDNRCNTSYYLLGVCSYARWRRRFIDPVYVGDCRRYCAAEILRRRMRQKCFSTPE